MSKSGFHCIPLGLVGEMNQFPNGDSGDSLHECRCSVAGIIPCTRKLSGPLRDHTDMFIDACKVPERSQTTVGRSKQPHILTSNASWGNDVHDVPLRVAFDIIGGRMAFKDWPTELQATALRIASDWAIAEVGPTLEQCARAPDIVYRSGETESAFQMDLRVAFVQAVHMLEPDLTDFLE